MADTTAPESPATRKPMNATVMTTGPGVIIATATASRNWRSFSQWKPSTTPPCRNGTIASPLPKTNAPASVKYQAMRQSSPSPGPRMPEMSQGGMSSADAVPADGRPALASSAAKPQPKKIQMISFSVQPVTTALIANSAMSTGSRPTVARVSLYALRTMTAMTAAPIP